MHQDTGERSSDPTRDWPRLACECPGVSSGGVGRQWPAAWSGALSGAVHGNFWRRLPLFSLPPPQFGLRSNNKEGTQPRPSTENWIKDLLRMGHHSHQNNTQFPPQPVSPIRKLPISLLSLSLSEGRQNEKHNHRKLTKLITWTTALPNSMKLWAMTCRPPKIDRSWWRILTKCGPLEKGMATTSIFLPWEPEQIGHWTMNSPGW